MPEHVGLVTTSYPVEGAEGQAAAGSFVADFAEELSRHVRVTVIAPALGAAQVDRGDLRVEYFPVPRLPLSLLSPLRPGHWPGIISTLRSGRRAVLSLCEQQSVDHLLALWVLPSGAWARAAFRRHGVPYSTWALGSDIWSLGKIPIIRGQLSQVLADAHRCYADGYELAGQVQVLGGRQCEFLPSTRQLPITGKRRIATGPPYRLAFLGRWHPNKGIDLLLEALQRLDDKDWALIEQVRIHGGGPLEVRVKEGVAALAVAGRPVMLGGYLDRHAAGELLSWADYLLLPSRIESIPVIFSDALQAGCVLISTPVGDLPRLLTEHRCGIMATATDAGALAAAMTIALRRTPGDFSASLAAAREQFSLETAVTSFLVHCRT